MVKINDRFQRDGKKYVVVEVGKRVVKARRVMAGGSLGYNVLSFSKASFR